MSANSPFMALPAELRLHIYPHVFSLPYGHRDVLRASIETSASEVGAGSQITEYGAGRVKINISKNITSCRDDAGGQSAGPHFTALLRTCRQIYEEAVEVLYQQTLFRISLGPEALECVDKQGRLWVRSPTEGAGLSSEDRSKPLPDLVLFTKMHNVHLDLNFGGQPNPVWDVPAVTRAILAALNPHRKHTTVTLRFGLMTAITCARISEGSWQRFVRDLKSIDLGCVPDVKIDRDAEKWSQYGKSRFEELRAVLGGQMDFVEFEEKLSPHDDGLRACVIL